MAPTEIHCDICQGVVPPSPMDEEGNEPFSLVEHRWSAHGIPGITRCDRCGEPLSTDALVEHLALRHDPPPPTDNQRAEREALRRQRADEDLRDELRGLLHEAREFLDEARESRVLRSGGGAASLPLGFGSTVAAIVCALLLFPVFQTVVAWAFDLIGLLLGVLIHAVGRKV